MRRFSPNSCVAILADDPVGRRPAETPDKTVAEKPAAAPAALLSPIPPRRNPRKRKLVSPGSSDWRRSPPRPYRRALFPGRTFLRGLDRRRLREGQQHHARRQGGGSPVGDHGTVDNALVRAACVDRLQDRRRRLPYRARRGDHQDRDPAGHHRPHRAARSPRARKLARRRRPRRRWCPPRPASSAPGSTTIASRV